MLKINKYQAVLLQEIIVRHSELVYHARKSDEVSYSTRQKLMQELTDQMTFLMWVKTQTVEV